MDVKPNITAGQCERLLEPLLGRSAGYARAIVGNRADAQDMVQEAALKLWRSIASFDPRRSFEGWFFAILRNCCRDLLRRRATQPLCAGIDDLPEKTAEAQDWEALRSSLGRLSSTHRQILELRYFGQCSYREIAGALEIPEGTVMSRLHAAREALAAAYRLENT